MAEDKSNLIVNYLPSCLTDDDFKAMFMTIGPIKTSRVMRDRKTNMSYGFGFVAYENPDDAERAIETLNGLELQNKRIKVAYSRKEEKGTNLYIRGLPPDLTEDDLRSMCEPYGTIISVRVLMNPVTNKGKGVAFVIYSRKSQAEEALKNLNGMEFENHDKKLIVDFAEQYTTKLKSGEQEQQSLHPATTGHYQTAPPQYYGGAQSGYYQSAYNHAPGRPHPYGEYRDPRYGGNPYYNGGYGDQGYYSNSNNMGNYPPPGPAGDTSGDIVIFIYNLKVDANDKELSELFAPYGTIVKATTVVDSATGKGKGYGFVTMANYRQAQNAVTSLNGYNHNGRKLQVSFKNKR